MNKSPGTAAQNTATIYQEFARKLPLDSCNCRKHALHCLGEWALLLRSR